MTPTIQLPSRLRQRPRTFGTSSVGAAAHAVALGHPLRHAYLKDGRVMFLFDPDVSKAVADYLDAQKFVYANLDRAKQEARRNQENNYETTTA